MEFDKPFHGHRYIIFASSLFAALLLDLTHIKHGVVVYSQLHH